MSRAGLTHVEKGEGGSTDLGGGGVPVSRLLGLGIIHPIGQQGVSHRKASQPVADKAACIDTLAPCSRERGPHASQPASAILAGRDGPTPDLREGKRDFAALGFPSPRPKRRENTAPYRFSCALRTVSGIGVGIGVGVGILRRMSGSSSAYKSFRPPARMSARGLKTTDETRDGGRPAHEVPLLVKVNVLRRIARGGVRGEREGGCGIGEDEEGGQKNHLGAVFKFGS